MRNYRLVGRDQITRASVELGIIQAESMAACELFIACNYPELFFGANISEVGHGKADRDFTCIAVKEWYRNEDGTYPTPVEVAVQGFNAKMKIDNGLCRTWTDLRDESVCRAPFDKLDIPCK